MKDNPITAYMLEARKARDRRNFITSAKYLRRIQEEAPDRFDAIVSLIGLSIRKAYYLISIDKKFAELKVDIARLDAIGWTKLQIIAPYITEVNCESLLLHAERYTARELKQVLKNKKITNGTKSILLHLAPGEYQIFAAALLENGAKMRNGGLQGKEKALVRALADYRK